MSRRRVTFDYPNTCPKIDKGLNEARAGIDKFLDDLLEEACPLLPRSWRRELVSDYGVKLREAIEPAFETVRSTNEDMRREAESQIASCFEDIDTLESEIDNLKAELRDLA